MLEECLVCHRFKVVFRMQQQKGQIESITGADNASLIINGPFLLLIESPLAMTYHKQTAYLDVYRSPLSAWTDKSKRVMFSEGIHRAPTLS